MLGFSVGYLLKPTTTIKPPTTSTIVEKVKESKIPECFAFKCPQYFSMTVDKDYRADESVVVIPMAMTQGAGKIMIIKKGKIIFESDELAGIGVEGVEDGDGFILNYSSPRDENLNNVQYSVRYRYKNGKFEPEGQGEKEKEKECVNNNGVWMKGNWNIGFYCNIKYTDGGKACKDSSDCMSNQCISYPKENNESNIVGQCANFVTNLGCYQLVKKGKLTNIACFD